MKSQQYLFGTAPPAPKRRARRSAIGGSPQPPAGLSRHLVILASAGTGKTFRLSNRYLQLLLAGVPAHCILASTFTRKAAGEILDRILHRLAEAAVDEQHCRRLAEQLQEPDLSCARCLELLSQLVHQLHRLRIGTLDAFVVQVAQSFSLELGLPPFWHIVDELDDARLRSMAIQSLLRDSDKSDLLRLVALLAKGEARRNISQLMRDTVDDLYELYLETDRQAWCRLKYRQELEGPALAMALERLRDIELPKGLQKARQADYERALAEDWEGFVSKGIAGKVAAGDAMFSRCPLPAEAIAVYQPLVEHARATLIRLVAMQTEGTYSFLDRFHQYYQRLKKHQRSMRFEDITRHLAQRVKGETGHWWSDHQQLAFRLDGRIEHLLLDEFQDTSLAQWNVLDPLARRVTDEPAHSFFCVGDVKQAIYGWRGGNAELFQAVSQQLQGLQHERLNTSYRSAPAVIETVNRIFEGIVRHPNLGRTEEAVRAFSKGFDPHETARGDLPGYACLRTSDCTANGVQSQQQTLTYAAEYIEQLHQLSPRHNIGVLVRKNEAVARLINELHARKVHASQEGGNPLTDSAAARLVLSALQLADHPGDSVASFHVSHSPLGPLIGLTAHDDQRAVLAAAQAIRRQVMEHGYGSTIIQWARTLAPVCNRREVNRLEQLVELAYAWQSQATSRTSQFVALVEAQKVMDPTAANVRVMTVHQAKGLQFDVVVLPDLDLELTGQTEPFVTRRPYPTAPVDRVCRYVSSGVRQLLPQEVQDMFPKAVEREVTESLCLLYVALTRAVHALHMIIPGSAVNERTLPRKVCGLLRVALHDEKTVKPNTLLFEQGSADWWRAEPRKGQQPDTESVEQLPARDEQTIVRLAPISGSRQRGLERSSPSALEGGRRVRLRHLLGRQSAAARQRGIVLHAWFEQIDWLEDGIAGPGELRTIAARLPDVWPSSEQLDQLLAQYQQVLTAEPIRQLLSKQHYQRAVAAAYGSDDLTLVVAKERPLAVRHGDELMAGTLDRLVLIYKRGELVGADIMDYKTDVLKAEDQAGLAERTEFYRPQLEAYTAALAQSFGLARERIACRLIFVSAGLVREL